MQFLPWEHFLLSRYTAISFLFISTSLAAPTISRNDRSLERRQVGDPGIGVELEARDIVFINEGAQANAITAIRTGTLKLAEEGGLMKNFKGSTIEAHEGHSGNPNLDVGDWRATAELEQSTIDNFVIEVIVKGETVKLRRDSDVLGGVWDSISKSMNAWAPHTKSAKKENKQVKVKGFESLGTWSVSKPASWSLDAIRWGMQLTSPLPMDAVQSYLIDVSKGEQKNPFLPTSSSKRSRVHVVKRDDVMDLKANGQNIFCKNDDITEHMLGFLSLVASYAKGTETARPSDGPKHSLSLMPRTDFITMYRLSELQDLLKEAKKRIEMQDKDKPPKQRRDAAKETSLRQIVQKLMVPKPILSDKAFRELEFKWDTGPPTLRNRSPQGNPPPPPPPPPMPDGRPIKPPPEEPEIPFVDEAAEIANAEKTGRVKVTKWLEGLDKGSDLVSRVDDKLRYQQIGKLGARTENNLFKPKEKCPIFELRDIGSAQAPQMKEQLAKFEKKVKEYHKGSRTRRNKRRAAAPKTCDIRPKCSGKQVPNNKGKCEDCGKGKIPDKNNAVCVREDNGCQDDEIRKGNKDQQSCEKCPKGEKPDPAGKKCQKDDGKNNDDTNEPDKKNEQGKCPDGQVLDPAQGKQDAKTEKPVCIPDDEADCKPGEGNSSRKKHAESKQPLANKDCSPDPKPDFSCPKGTYDYKEVRDNEVRHSCRATRAADEEKKKKYNDFVKPIRDAKDKKDDERDKERENNKEADDRRRKRVGLCFTMMAGFGVWSIDDIEKMSNKEIDGMVGMWPDGDKAPATPEKEIQDYMVKVEKNVVSGLKPRLERRFLGLIFRALAQAFKRIFRSPKSASGGRQFREIRYGDRRRSPEATKAARESKMVERIFGDDRMLSCLASAATAAFATDVYIGEVRHKLSIDWEAEPNGTTPIPKEFEDRQLEVKLADKTDKAADKVYYTYPDEFSGREDRINYEACTKIDQGGNVGLDKWSSVETNGGCCAYYDDKKCSPDKFMFAMGDRKDHGLDGDDNNAITSMWCTFKDACAGAPGLKSGKIRR